MSQGPPFGIHFRVALWILIAAGVFGPSGVLCLRAAAVLARHTPIDFAFYVRLPAIIADAGIAWLLRDVLRRRGYSYAQRPGVVALVAAGPMLGVISAYTSQFDTVVALPGVVAVWMWEGRAATTTRAAPAGCLLGISYATKTGGGLFRLRAPQSVAVVGAGVGGLAAAIRLLEAGYRVTIFDPAPRPGGLAGGFAVGGGSVERFYHHLFRSDTTAQAWIRDLGLDDRLEFLPADMGFYANGALYRFGTPASLLRFSPLPVMDRFRLGLRIRALSTKAECDGFESITAMEWLRRHASPTEVSTFWEPLLAAKFGQDRDEISMAWLWARFRARVGGSVGRGERLGYLRGGFQQLGDAMAARVCELGGEMRMNTRIGRVAVENSTVCGVQVGDEVCEFGGVVWTPSLSYLPAAVPSLPDDYKAACGRVKYHHALVAVVELESQALPYYWVTIGDSALPFTVAVEHTRLVGTADYDGRTIVYLGRYAAPEDPLLARADDEIVAAFLGAAASSLSAEFAKPLAVHLFRGPGAQPIVPPGWATDKPALHTGITGLVVANMAQIYPWDRGINYSIALGEAAAGAVIEELVPA